MMKCSVPWPGKVCGEKGGISLDNRERFLRFEFHSLRFLLVKKPVPIQGCTVFARGTSSLISGFLFVGNFSSVIGTSQGRLGGRGQLNISLFWDAEAWLKRPVPAHL